MVRLTKIQPALNQARYYQLSIQMGLFGEVALIRQWGRIGQSGCAKTDWFTCINDAETELHKLWTQKKRKGYG